MILLWIRFGIGDRILPLDSFFLRNNQDLIGSMTSWIEVTLAAVDKSRNELTNAQDAIAATPSGLPLGEMKEVRDRLREHHIMELRAALLNSS